MMVKRHVLLMLFASIFVGCADASPAAPDPVILAEECIIDENGDPCFDWDNPDPDPPAPEDPDDEPLTLDVSRAITDEGAFVRVLQPQVAQHTVAISGGSGSYYVHWIAQICRKVSSTGGTTEECLPPFVFDEGAGRTSTFFNYADDMGQVIIQAQAREIGTPHRTGVDKELVLGPATFEPVVNNAWSCSTPPDWFPYDDYQWEFNHETNEWELEWVARHARGTCSGAKIYG